MSQEQLRNQVRLQVDRNIKLLETSLRDRGSDLRSITQQRDQIEIGVFPQTIGFDFYILEPVTIVIGQANATFTFQIQTTFYVDNGMPEMAKGLWFPLAVKDQGSDKPCELARVVLTEKERKYSPVVDLTIGDPPRALASRLIDVVDISTDKKQNIPRHDVRNMSPSPTPSQSPAPSPTPEPTPTPTTTPQPTPPSTPLQDRWPQRSSVPPSQTTAPPTPAPPAAAPQEPSGSKDTVDNSEEEPKSKKKSRYERRKERRERRHHYRRSRRHRSSRNQVPALTEPPVKEECVGDLSPSEKVKCWIQGK